MKRVGFAAVAALALQAEEPTATTVRSLVTSAAGLTDVGVLVLELGGSQTYAKDDTREGGVKAQLDLGLASWVDLRCGWTVPAWNRDADGHSNSGASDPYVGGQLLFASQAKAGADIGLIYSHLLPRASVRKGLSSGFHEDTLLLAASRSLGRWAVDANAGIVRTRVEDGSRKANQKAGSFAITYAPAQGWNLSLDTHGAAKSDLGGRELGNTLAASYDVNDKLKVDMSVEHGWADASPRFAFNAGLMYRIGKLW